MSALLLKAKDVADLIDQGAVPLMDALVSMYNLGQVDAVSPEEVKPIRDQVEICDDITPAPEAVDPSTDSPELPALLAMLASLWSRDAAGFSEGLRALVLLCGLYRTDAEGFEEAQGLVDFLGGLFDRDPAAGAVLMARLRHPQASYRDLEPVVGFKRKKINQCMDRLKVACPRLAAVLDANPSRAVSQSQRRKREKEGASA